MLCVSWTEDKKSYKLLILCQPRCIGPERRVRCQGVATPAVLHTIARGDATERRKKENNDRLAQKKKARGGTGAVEGHLFASTVGRDNEAVPRCSHCSLVWRVEAGTCDA